MVDLQLRVSCKSNYLISVFIMKNNIFSKVKIEAVASVVPKQKQHLNDFIEKFGEKEINKIMKSTGISEVAIAEEGMTSSDYAYEAANKLINEINIDVSTIDALLFLTESPDYTYPGVAPILQNRLGLRKDTINLDLHYACSGYIYSLFYASLLIESGYCDNVLLLAGDTLSHFININDRALRMINGDAACATLIKRSESVINSYYNFYVDGSGFESLMIPAGGRRFPSKHGVTDVVEYDKDGNGKTLENIQMKGMDIMVFAVDVVPRLVESTINGINWNKDDVSIYAFHQANKLIIDRIAKKLSIPTEKVPICLEHYGNTGFNSIPLMMCTDFDGKNSNLDKVIACGFGAGLIAASAALNFSNTTFIKTFEV